jgi:TadE-like protein
MQALSSRIPVDRKHGQALVEFAIILPLLLLLILEVIAFSLFAFQQSRLQHAAQQVAIYASNDECSGALGKVPQVLGFEPDFKSCSVFPQYIEITLGDDFPQVAPIIPTWIEVNARSLVLESPSP